MNKMDKIKKIIGIKNLIPYRWSMWYYEVVRPIFKPNHGRLRKAIPRTWCDITSLITTVNFEFIKSFYEEEYLNGVVDWTSNEEHIEFSNWLEEAYLYITKERLKLESQRDNSYPKTDENFLDRFEKNIADDGSVRYLLKDDGIPYEQKYAEVIRLEKIIEDRDEQILIEMIKKKEYFWT